MEAIIQQGKNQFKVKKGDLIEVDKLGLEPKDKVVIDKVLVLTDGEKHTIGAPYINKAKVTAQVVEHDKAAKVINFRYKKKKGYHRTVGHRQNFTVIQIDKIEA